MRVALDTNILAYAEGVNGAKMRATALDLIQKLSPDLTILPVQTLGELFNVFKCKGRANARARPRRNHELAGRLFPGGHFRNSDAVCGRAGDRP